MFFFLKPAIASILAYIIFKERINGIQIFGIIIIIFGINIENIRNLIKKKWEEKETIRSDHDQSLQRWQKIKQLTELMRE